MQVTGEEYIISGSKERRWQVVNLREGIMEVAFEQWTERKPA